MKSKLWVATLATLVIGVLLLGRGFHTYAEMSMDKHTIGAPDGSSSLNVEEKKDGTSFTIKKKEPAGKMQSQSEWAGKLLKLEWTKDSSRYMVNREEQGIKKVEIIHSKACEFSMVNDRAKDAIYKYIEKENKKAVAEDAELSLEFQSWCDDNEAMFVKYEVMEQEQVTYSGYIIWKDADNEVKAFYETM